MSILQAILAFWLVFFILLSRTCFGDELRERKYDIQSFIEDGLPEISLTDNNLSKLVIIKMGSEHKLNWTEFTHELRSCRLYKIIVPGIQKTSTFQYNKNSSHNYLESLSTDPTCKYYINTENFFKDSVYDALKIYKSFGEKLYEALPKEIWSLHLIGEGVAALSLAVTAKKVRGSSVYLTLFNPILLEFSTRDYTMSDFSFSELVFGDINTLSRNELINLKRTNNKSKRRVWLFLNYLGCENILNSIRSASTMYLKAKKRELKNYEICQYKAGNCSILNGSSSLKNPGVFQFKRINSTECHFDEKVSDGSENYVEQYLNTLSSSIVTIIKGAENVTEADLAKLVITNLGTLREMNWTEFKDQMKNNTRNFTIILPGIQKFSTLQGKPKILENKFIHSSKSLIKHQYYIDTKNLYKDSMYNALKIYKSFGERLFDVIPNNAGSIDLIGEGVSALSLSVMANALSSRNKKLHIFYSAFNPILLDFHTTDYNNRKYYSEEWIFGDVNLLSNKELRTLRREKNISKRVWIFKNITSCKDLLCSNQKSSDMYLLAKYKKLENYEICKLVDYKCSNLSKEEDIFDDGVFQLTNLTNEGTSKSKPFDQVEIFIKKDLQRKNFLETNLAQISVLDIDENKTTELNWSEFGKELKYASGRLTLIVPGVRNISTLQCSKNLMDNDFIRSRRISNDHLFYINTTNLYNDSIDNDLNIEVYKSFGVELGKILPTNHTNSIQLIGEGVSALSIARSAHKFLYMYPRPIISLTAFNPIFLNFKTNDFIDFLFNETEVIISDLKSLSVTEFNELRKSFSKWKIWLFNETLYPEDILLTKQKASTLYLEVKKGNFKKICKFAGDNCLNIQTKEMNRNYRNGIFLFTKASPSKNQNENKLQVAINRFKNEDFPEKDLNNKDLEKLVFTNYDSNDTTNITEIKNRFNASTLEYLTIVIPGLINSSTLQDKVEVKEIINMDFSVFINKKYKLDYYIYAAHLFNDSLYDSLTVFRSLGEKLSEILPDGLKHIYLIGEDVSALALAALAKKLKLRNPKVKITLTAFNPILEDFLIEEFKSLQTNFFIGATEPLSSVKLNLLQTTVTTNRIIWLLIDNNICKDIDICAKKKTSTMYLLVRKEGLASYEICKLKENTCSKISSIFEMYSNNMLQFTKILA